MEKTVFKKIIDKELPADIVYEDDKVMAFHDISKSAPVHILVIPKKEIKNLEDASKEDMELLGYIQLIIQKIARDFNLEKDGYRVITNINSNGGQTVYHLHYHIMGGRKLGIMG